MSLIQALVLGIVQGLGEFLPISSSGHLLVLPWLLRWPDQSLEFDVALHVGTLAAVVWAFMGDWRKIVGDAFSALRAGQPFRDADAQMLWLLAAASVPGAVAGLLLEHKVETVFRSPALVSGTMAALGLVLFLADRHAGSRLGESGVGWRDALIIGVAQALAVIPGVSRSGATISMALFLGHPRERAARFSFLLATPITLGAALVKVPHLLRTGDLTAVTVGMVAAAVAGLASIKLLLGYVRTRTYRPFVYYRWAFAVVVLAVLLGRR